jgi:hypothetical protein
LGVQSKLLEAFTYTEQSVKHEEFTDTKGEKHKILNIPNHACCSPCTSIAKPKSASLTAAPFCLLANNKFSGYGRKSEKQQQKNVLMIC